jgi:hypothetical protein
VPLPEPSPGLVIRYDYLWIDEAALGRDQGKDRPACLLAASDAAVSPRFVVILPITHTPPAGDTVGVEIPPKVKEAIGLDDARSWVIVSEHNVDEWPNGGLAPLPGTAGHLRLRLHSAPLVRSNQSEVFGTQRPGSRRWRSTILMLYLGYSATGVTVAIDAGRAFH